MFPEKKYELTWMDEALGTLSSVTLSGGSFHLPTFLKHDSSEITVLQPTLPYLTFHKPQSPLQH